MLCLVAVSRVPLPQVACGSGWRKLRTRVALSVGLAWRFASDSGGENFGLGIGASLRGADLRSAYLRLTRLDGADLSSANLYGSEGLTTA